VQSFLMWSPLPKSQRRIKTLRHSPCGDTPIAPTAAVTTDGVSLLVPKILFLFPYSTLRRCDTLPVVTATVEALGVPSQGQYQLIKYRS
jgi:hypothetical protein